MLYLGADHRGYNLKEQIKDYLKEQNIDFEDLGNVKLDKNDDYPDFAIKVAEKVSKDQNKNKGILLCGSGIGMDIAANKFMGVRSALCLSSWMAQSSRQDDDSNVLCLASDVTDIGTASHIINTWMNTKFSDEERHRRRINKIKQLENKN